MENRLTPAHGRLFVFAAALILGGMAQAGDLNSERQDQFIEVVSQGEDPSAILKELDALEPDGTLQPVLSTVAEQLDKALVELRAAAAAALAEGVHRPAVQERLVAAYEGAVAARLLVGGRLEVVGQTLEKGAASTTMRYRQAGIARQFGRSAYAVLSGLESTLGRIGGVTEPVALFANPDFRDELTTALGRATVLIDNHTWHPPRKILRASTLPYRTANLAPRAPKLAPEITPGYAQKEDAPAEQDDLAPTPDAPLSQAIIAQAEALEHDYIRLYEFVHSTIRTQWYAGAMKGAEQTLREGAGNDVDQANLLIALYRASGLAARYVQGVVELPVEAVMESLGLTDPNQAVQALRKAGVAFEPRIRGGRVAALHIEHTWVSARVPYTNYRGAMVDASGPQWLPLAPALKRYEVTPATIDLGGMGITADGFITDYLGGPQAEGPLSLLRKRVNETLLTAGQSYDGALGSVALDPEPIGLLPNTLPVPVVAVTGEQASLAPEQRQWLRFVVYRGTAETAPVILDHTIPVSGIAGRRMTLSYIPATVEDHKIINLFGGLDYVPPYLVQLRPQLKLDGRRVAVAGEGLSMGRDHRLEIHLMAPAGTERLDYISVAGSYHAIGVDARHHSPADTEALMADAAAQMRDSEDDASDTEYQAAKLLGGIARRYARQWSAAEEELARIMNVAVIRPYPSIAVVGNVHDVDWLLGQPHQMHWSGVSIDAALRVAEPVARDEAADAARQWMRLSALQGSYLEHKTFEELFLVDSISADKGLQLARAASMEVIRVDSVNLEALLPSLNHPAEVLADIRTWVQAGMAVHLPVGPITHESWQGSVWVVESPEGAGGYFIAGGLAGGQTSVPGPGWTLGWLADILASPNSLPPNPDPEAGVSIAVVEASTGQEGVVNREVPEPLVVIVKDAKGRPVVGAPVTFIISEGRGVFLQETEEGVSEVEGRISLVTDERGRASVGYRLGKNTWHNPIFLYREPDDEHPTRATLNVIDVVAEGRRGRFFAPAPLQLIAYPDEPESMTRTNSCCLGALTPDVAADYVNLQVHDKHNNPVSNVEMSFFLEQTAPRVSGSSGRLLVDERSGQFLDLKTGPFGTGVVVVLGSGFQHYKIHADALAFHYERTYELDLPGCGDIVTTFHRFEDEQGHNIAAAKVGATFGPDVGTEFKCWDPEANEYYPADVENVGVDVTNGGTATPAVRVDGRWETRVTVGPEPGINEVTMLAGAVQCRLWEDPESICEGAGAVSPYSVNIVDVFGIDPKIAAFETAEGLIDPQSPARRIAITEEGATSGPVTIHHKTLPQEYYSGLTQVEVLEDGVSLGALTSPWRSDTGKVTLPRGYQFDIESEYKVQLLLNGGSRVVVRSDAVELPLVQPIFKDHTDFFTLSQDVDLLNNRACAMEATFEFITTQPAAITLIFFDAANPDYKRELISGEFHEAGEHAFPISISDLPAGEYLFELKGVSQVDGHEDKVGGAAHANFSLKQIMPVGHTIVQGVDVNDGSLSLSRADIEPIAVRGTDLDFRRTYSSTHSGVPGGLGAGWHHNWDSTIVITPCGEVIVIGGQGGGMRFVEDEEGNLKPLKGYNGALIPNMEDRSFDFYPKDGTRYHYTHLLDGKPVWHLEYIEDTNGNVTSFGYTTDDDKARLTTVRDAGGRTLSLEWGALPLDIYGPKPGWFITSVSGPGGIRIDYEHDEFGNLITATRGAGTDNERKEFYDYQDDPELAFAVRHKLVNVIDPIGGSTRYQYNEAKWTVEGNAATYTVPMSAVERIDGPEGLIGSFTYDSPGQAGARTTAVRNGRGKTTYYTQNEYGSTTVIDAPHGRTTMNWNIDKVQLDSRTDANGVTTWNEYDDNGNTISEKTDPREIRREYRDFADKPWIKNRVSVLTEVTELGSNVTYYEYDGSGNLTAVKDPQGNTTYHSYAENGDRLLTQDPRGNTTRYDLYDVHGNPESVTAPLGNIRTQKWDVRSRKTSETDARGVSTDYHYNGLDQLVKIIGPTGIRAFTYDANGNKLTETDEEDRTTLYTYDKAGRLKTMQNPAGDIRRFEYDTAGNKTLETDWEDNPTTFEYDGEDRLIEKRRKGELYDRVTTYEYDGNGNLTKETDPLGRSTTYTYDSLNRRTSLTDHLENRSEFSWDGQNKIADLDPLKRRTTYEYDGNNRLLRKVEPLGRSTAYEYDENGNRIAETDPNGHTRRVEYDALNRPIRRIDTERNVWTFEYDANGNKTAEIDPRLSATRYRYDEANRLASTTDPAHYTTEYDYDKVGNRVTERHPDGNVVIHTYDVLNRLLATEDSLGPVVAATYDGNGNKLTETDAEGRLTTHLYDAFGRLTSSHLPEKRTVSFGYDQVGNRIAQTDARGHTTRTEYDALNRPVKIIDPLDNTVESTWDEVGNKLTETDKRGNVTTWEYDALNRPVKITDALGQTLRSTYDAVGNVLSETDKRGAITAYTYDRENRRTTVNRAGVRLLETDHDAVGNKAFESDANGNITAYLYDARNRLITESRPEAAISHFTYGPMGRRTSERDPEGRTTEWTYDERGRVLSETNAAGESTRYTWDGNGNRLTRKRPRDNTWRYAYDDAGRLTQITDPKGGVTAYSWDGNGNRTGVTDANGHTTTYEYDVLNRKALTRYHDGATEQYGYDEAGNRTRLIDARGQRFNDTFDGLNRRTLAEYPAPALTAGGYLTRIATEYDANNNPIHISESFSDGRTRLTQKRYDAFDRLTTVIDPDGKGLSYGYDKNGNRTALSDPDGRVSRYAFDALNRLTAVTAQTGITEYAYDRSGRKTRVTYPNGTQIRYGYDAPGRLKSLLNQQGATVLSRYDYTLDENGNRLTQVEQNGGPAETTTYAYDGNDRLTEVVYPDKRVTTTYDAAYNRTGETTQDTEGQVLSDKTFAYNARNQLTGITDATDSSQNVIYQYDANGNRTVKSKNGVVTTFLYDTRDQLIGVREEAVTLGTFRYDYQGLRIGKTAEEGETKYIYDGDSVLLQTDADGNSLAKYDYGPDQLLSLNHKDEGRQFYHFDGLGSVANLTNAEGVLQARYQYDAWGNIREEAGASANIFGFTGHERDRETGLYYFKARFYDPDTGRFLNQDPYLGEIDTAPSLHRYLYAYANPVVYIDPDGHESMLGAFFGLERRDLSPSENRMLRQVHQTGIKMTAAGGAAVVAAPVIVAGGGEAALLTRAGVQGTVQAGRAVVSEVARYGVIGAAAGNPATTTVVAAEATAITAAVVSGADTPVSAAEAAAARRLKNAAVRVVESSSGVGVIGVSQQTGALSAGSVRAARVPGSHVEKELLALPAPQKPAGLLEYKSGNKTDFYVGPQGPEATMPATAYRYMRYLDDNGNINKHVENTLSNSSAPGGYFGVKAFNTGKEARDAYQVRGPELGDSWSDARLRGEFDTLQLYEGGKPRVIIPTEKGGRGSKAEPFTRSYPEYGYGGEQQFYTEEPIKFRDLEVLPEG